MKEGKSFQISQNEVLNAYKAVKADKGAGGVDGVELESLTRIGRTDYTDCGTGWPLVRIFRNR